MDIRVRRLAEGDDLPMFGMLYMNPRGALKPFSVHRQMPEYSPGFTYSEVDRDDFLSITQALEPSDLLLLLGADNGYPAIGYGLETVRAELIGPDEVPQPLVAFMMTEDYFNLFGVLTEPPLFGGDGKPGMLEMMQSLLMDLEPGYSLHLVTRIHISQRRDAAALLDRLYRGPLVQARTDAASAAFLVRDAEGNPVTHVYPDAEGTLRFRLPKGLQQGVLEAHGSSVDAERIPFEVDGELTDLGSLSLPAPARLMLPQGQVMRLVFKGQGDTPDPLLGSEYIPFRYGERDIHSSGTSNSLNLGGIASDLQSVLLAPGRYRVYATRGLEYSLTTADITLTAGERTVLEIQSPERVLETPGWVSADFHVHSAFSFDSSYAPLERLRGFAAQGGEILVATEHDYVPDFAPLLAESGLGTLIQVIPGSELTGISNTEAVPTTIGHLNAFPIVQQPRQFSGGLPLHEGMRLHSLIATLRKHHPDSLLQLNHPREAGNQYSEGAFFSHLSVGSGYDPQQPLTAEPNRSLLEPGTQGYRISTSMPSNCSTVPAWSATSSCAPTGSR